MKLTNQKRLAASALKASEKRIWLDQSGLTEIKEAITKADIKSLINKGVIGAKPKRGISKARTRQRKTQKSKGRQKGSGTKKGKKTARLPQKLRWMKKIRIQRIFLKELKTKELITTKTFNILYKKSKGNFFRSVRHMKLYLGEHELVNKK